MASKVLKGLTIEIGGDTTKLGKALENVEKKGRDLSNELGEINKLLKFDPKNTQLLAQKQQVLGEAVSSTKEKLDKLREAEKQVQAQFEKGEASEEQVRALQREIMQTENKLKSYERAVEETTAEIEKLGKETDETENAINDLGDGLDKTQKELNETSNEAEKAGKGLDKAGGKGAGFGEKVQKAGGMAAKGLTAVVSVLGAVVTGLSAATVNAAAYADEILTTSTVTGMSTDKLQEFKYASDLVDVSVETLTKSMAKNIKSMDSAGKGSKAYADTYKKLGVAVKDANGQLRDSETVYWETIDALGKIENETERDAMAMQLFGKSAQELNPLIEAGSEKMKELGQEAHDVGAVMSGDALEAMGAFDDSIQRLKGSAGASKNALGTILLPELQLLSDAGSSFLNDFTRNLNDSGGGLDGFITTVDSMSGKLGTMLSDLISNLLDKATRLAPSLINVALSLITTVVPQILSTLPQKILPLIVDTFNSLVSALPGLVSALSSALPTLTPLLFDGLVSMVLTLCSTLPLVLQPIIDSLSLLLENLISGLLSNLPALSGGLISLVVALIPMIPQLLNILLNSVLFTFNEQWASAVMELIPVLLVGVGELIWALIQALPGLLLAVVKVIAAPFIQLFVSMKTIWEKIKNVFAPVGNWFSDIFSKAWNKLKAAFSIDAIKKYFSDIWSGVKKAFGSVTDWFRDTFSKAWTAVKNVFSTGGKVFDGIKAGISDVFKTVVNSIIRGINKVIATPFNAINKLLNTVRGVSVVGIEPFKSLWKHNPLTVPKIPELAKGGILEKGQVGLLEGDGAEAVVPLERNLHWLQRVAEMLAGLLTDELDGLQLERGLYNRSVAAPASAAVDGLGNKLDSILAAIEHGQILTIDSNALVGATAGKMDNTLGQRRTLAARGAL